VDVPVCRGQVEVLVRYGCEVDGSERLFNAIRPFRLRPYTFFRDLTAP
jgi:hypothetical protein